MEAAPSGNAFVGIDALVGWSTVIPLQACNYLHDRIESGEAEPRANKNAVNITAEIRNVGAKIRGPLLTDPYLFRCECVPDDGPLTQVIVFGHAGARD